MFPSCVREGSLVSYWFTAGLPGVNDIPRMKHWGIVTGPDPRYTQRWHDLSIFWSSGKRGHFSEHVFDKAVAVHQIRVEIF